MTTAFTQKLLPVGGLQRAEDPEHNCPGGQKIILTGPLIVPGKSESETGQGLVFEQLVG